MKTALNLHFKTSERYSATIGFVSIDKYDDGSRYKEITDGDGNPTGVALIPGTPSSRTGILVIVRHAYTGTPFTGIAVVSPNDVEVCADENNIRRATLQAARKACMALAFEDHKHNAKLARAYGRLMMNSFESSYNNLSSINGTPDYVLWEEYETIEVAIKKEEEEIERVQTQTRLLKAFAAYEKRYGKV